MEPESRGRRAALRLVYTGGMGLFLLVVVVQFFLAGLGVFGASSFDAHEGLGHVAYFLAALLLVVGALARLPRSTLVLTAVLLALTIVQAVLPELADDVAEIAALHPVVALVIFALAHALVRRSRDYLAAGAGG